MRDSALRPVFVVHPADEIILWGARIVLRAFQILIAAPSLLFLAALTAMLLRHPDVKFYEIDRVAFAVLLLAVLVRAMALRRAVVVIERATWPMLGLTILTFASVAAQPFDNQAWSLLAAKFIVPFALFHASGLVFTEERHLRQFEVFSLLVLAYLSFMAIAFLCGAHSLIFPRFILDESLGIQADRARGPLLQSVANGVSLNMLALVALHAFRRSSKEKLWIAIVLASVPVAILATMTRAVWLSFAGTVVAVIALSKERAVRVAGIVAALLTVLCVLAMVNSRQQSVALADRLEERGPVEFREAVYAGCWQMFLQKPWTGWGFGQIPVELARYVTGYREKELYPHNTYLELMVGHGVLGFALYLWLMWELWRLGRGPIPADEKNGFLSDHFHQIWPILLGVYWVNAAVVVMSYQFVNGLLFTMAGMLAAQRRRVEALPPC